MRYLSALAALLFWSSSAYAADTPSSQPADSAQDQPMPSQGDPAWRSLSIGNTTVGKSGCLVFSLMDALTSMGLKFSSPTAFIQMLKDNGLFTSAGMLSSLYGGISALQGLAELSPQ